MCQQTTDTTATTMPTDTTATTMTHKKVWTDEMMMDARYGGDFLEFCLAYYKKHPKFSLIKPILHMLCEYDDDYVEDFIWYKRYINNYTFDFKIKFEPCLGWDTKIPIYFLEDDYKMVFRVFEGDDEYCLKCVNGSSGFSLLMCNFEETICACECCNEEFNYSELKLWDGGNCVYCEECIETKKQLINISKFNLIIRDKLPVDDNVENHIYKFLLG